ncbi:hypothetical protein [Leptolyngbya sp. FACHB-261]|uniref:hypothetical protein n=1 Tax=Leptolyngbya sp. FACHB-261 TaxID=2692806 RepID=UPI00168470A6|nr:hypothetical protein [Leptolyngbya sp. FACHB-261]MBD2103903.1 hypothetical protein [Leptolyngbya sp. FACHB-261]
MFSISRSCLLVVLFILVNGTNGCALNKDDTRSSNDATSSPTNSPPASSIACTGIFAWSTVKVVDSQNKAVEGMQLTTTNGQTGRVYKLSPETYLGNGVYVIFNDAFRDEVRQKLVRVNVMGQKGTASFKETFVFGTDAAGCHIQKRSGPNTIVLPQ